MSAGPLTQAAVHFQVSHDAMAKAYRRMQLMREPCDIDLRICKTTLTLVCSAGGVRSRAEAAVTDASGFETADLFQRNTTDLLSLSVSSDLFGALLHPSLQTNRATSIGFTFARDQLDARGARTITGEIIVGERRLLWPFRYSAKPIAPPLTASERASSTPVAAAILGQCLQLARPFADTKRPAFEHVCISGGIIFAEQNAAVRLIDAPELGGLDAQLSRDTAGALGFALPHLSPDAKLWRCEDELVVFDEVATLRCTVVAAREPRPLDLGQGGVAALTSDFMTSLSRIRSQLRKSEQHILLHLPDGLAEGLRLETPVPGGIAVATCPLQASDRVSRSEGAAPSSPARTEARLPIAFLKALGIDGGRPMTIRFIEAGVLFIENKDNLTITTVIAASRT